MLRVEMYYTVKTLLDKGKNISEISRELGIDRKTVRKIRDSVSNGEVKAPEYSRKSVLDAFREEILEYLGEGFSAVLIHQELVKLYDLSVSYSCVKKYVRKLKSNKTAFVPLITPPGEEAQVDFGYVGYFYDPVKKKKVKVWVFAMVLSYSRLKYYELVQSQDIPTFLQCHINGFEYFKGAVKVVKIDNLKSGVLKNNFYEAKIQREYAKMLEHYGSSPFACKVRRPEEKGKVESGIKYVKNNFFKSNRTNNLSEVKKLLKDWQENTCNKRIHGTTRKIPIEQYIEKEKSKLLKLPSRRYDIYEVSERVVNSYSHVTYRYNYYSVPHKYIHKKVTIRSNNKLLRIYNDVFEEIAVHPISNLTGEFITQESHNPRLKKVDYNLKSLEIGDNVYNFCLSLQTEKPYLYQRIMHGIFDLSKKYGNDVLDLSCKRAKDFGSLTYSSVKRICELGLYKDNNSVFIESVKSKGFSNDLSHYDLLIKYRGK